MVLPKIFNRLYHSSIQDQKNEINQTSASHHCPSHLTCTNRKVAVVTFAHDGTSFMFDQRGKLQAQLIFAQRVMVNGREQFQKRSIGTFFTKSERDRLEKLAKDGSKEILSKFRR